MAFTLGDIFIGNFPVTQDFGADPVTYSARFGLKGHNGVDFGCPTQTMILSAADGFVSEEGFDTNGYGNYIKIVHDGYLTLYGHLNDKQVKQGDRVVKGQLIGHSNNTGFSTAPHLHFGVAPCDGAGTKTQPGNGYSGYIDPMNGELCHWTILNLTEPVSPTQPGQPDIPVKASDFSVMVPQGTNYKIVAAFAEQNGINQFIQSLGSGDILDLEHNPADPHGGEKITNWLTHLLTEQPAKQPDVTQVVSQLSDTQKSSILQTILSIFFKDK